jgi:DHA2 family multidrug resistance protein-like MFS transporter
MRNAPFLDMAAAKRTKSRDTIGTRREGSHWMSETSSGTATPPTSAAPDAPERASLVLIALILVAAVANLNLSVANVALPDIGKSFDSSQTALDLIAVGYSLGLAASVLWLGALGDRYGRKLMIVLGMGLSVPASLLAGFAWSDSVLFVARLLGGLSAGMAYPTTLALITALWSGAARTKSIALWSALGGGFALLGPLVAGGLLEYFDWGSVFLVTLPLVAIALPMAIFFVPGHVNETSDPVDNLGGLLTAVVVGVLIISINFMPVPNEQKLALGLLAVAVVLGVVFVIRERRVSNPLFDLHVAARSTFWVAACAGIIVFGSLMGAAFISQQYLQNVLGYSTIEAGAAIIPAGVFMVLVAPRSAKLVGSHGSRATLLLGQSVLFLAFLVMFLLWKEGTPYWEVAIPYALVGIGVGLAGTPSSNSLTGSVPVTRVGMASGTADLQRDLGGALMTSIFGALLTAGYASAMGAAIAAAPNAGKITDSTQSELQLSFASAENLAKQHPHYASQITAAAKSSFLKGDQWAYFAAMVAVLIGMGLVYRFFPRKDEELALRASYHAEDSARDVPAPARESETGPAPATG